MMAPSSPILNTPFQIHNHRDAHEKWCLLLKKAQLIVADDMEQQRKAAQGMRLKQRNFPPETVGRTYANYCDLINKMYDAYLKSVHLQRAPYMLELISVFLKRVYELRAELELIIVNDYIYVDGSLRQLHMTPFDIQIVVPYHIALESRPQSMEKLLQKMWAEAYKRKLTPTATPSKSELSTFDDLTQKSRASTVPSAKSESMKKESMPVTMKQSVVYAATIQKHERFRRWYIADYAEKSKQKKSYFAVEPKPLEIRIKAAELIKKIHREFMRIKRVQHRNAKVDMLLGVIPDPFRHRMSYEEENNKVNEKYRLDRERIRKAYMQEQERENARLFMIRKEDQIDDITDEIYAWFREWYEGYGFFPQYPYEVEGGTLVVIRGDYLSIEEKIEADEKLLKATKGKTKEQIKKDQEKVKADEAKAARAVKDAARKEAEALLKARMNPRTDPGYTVQPSKCKEEIADVLAKYRASWSIYDKHPDENHADYVYGLDSKHASVGQYCHAYMLLRQGQHKDKLKVILQDYITSLLTEEVLSLIHVDCRKYVDELRKLDLKLLNKAQKKMFKLEEKAWPKIKPRKKPRPPPRVKPFIVGDALMKTIQDVFDLELITKPTNKLKDIWGDFNYAAYEYSVLDPNVEFKPPGYGDIRRRLLLSCAFGSGFAPGAKRIKSLLLLGPERNGKSFLVDCVAGEINAVKIDISPEKFSAVSDKPAKLINKVLTAARAFQPAVIFLKDVERVFAKKIPPEQKFLKAKVMDALLTKMIKGISEKDKIIFIATCSFPLLARPKMTHLFQDSILVPITDYGNLQFFFYHKLQAIRSIPRDYCVQSIAKLLVGYGFGIIFELFDRVMTPHRIVTLNVKQLDDSEFLQPLLDAALEPVSQEDYKVYVDFYNQHSHLQKKRLEYEIINASRAVAYEKLAKAAKAKERKALAKPKPEN